MVLSLTYRRPAYVSSHSSIDSEKPAESISSGTSSQCGIPDALSFDKIISGGTCPVRFLSFVCPRMQTDSFPACNPA